MEHVAVRCGGGVGPVLDRHKRDGVVGQAEVDVPSKGFFAETDGNRDEKTAGVAGTRGATGKMGVELADVVGVGEGVAGTQGEHGQGGRT